MLRKTAISVAVISAISSLNVYAEGYKLFEQSVSSMGNAYAGRGAQVTDATLVYSNPAALTQLDGAQFSGGVSVIDAQTNYRNMQAQSANGQAVVGRTEGHNTLTEAVPFLFYADHYSEQLSWGIGFYVPFGLSSDYDNDFVGRYFADETSIQVLSIQPAVGYQLSKQWSIGAAVSVNRVAGTLSKYKDHSGLCELGEQGTLDTFRAPVYNEAYCNSHYEVSGDDIALGYSLGIHGEPIAGTRLAFSYHSQVSYTLKGDSTITNTPITGANVAGSPDFIVLAPHLPAIDKSTGKLAANKLLTEKSKLNLTTPASAAFSLDQQFTDAFSLQFTAAWTEWSKFESIDIVSNDPNPSISTSTQLPQNLNAPGYIGYIPEQWQNSWSYALGATYIMQPDLTLKAGIAYDENPIPQSHKTARIPTSDRTWLTVGANWAVSKKVSLDFAYGYLFTGDVSIDENEYNVQDKKLYNSNVTGDYSNKAQVFAVQANYHF